MKNKRIIHYLEVKTK